MSLTTNGLHLVGDTLDRLVTAHPDKVHISIHFPEQTQELMWVRDQVMQLEALGILKPELDFG
ncbi:hypothetical protein [Synechococcus sp. PCC 7502]|uniref:hypothetical protein n=1 Tax=Synechococcus sp. PCC 7502 TaxID=1173263 RepID=UPI0003067321|nr:hypothetical protein [Synechococcus sp. PCC 7502]